MNKNVLSRTVNVVCGCSNLRILRCGREEKHVVFGMINIAMCGSNKISYTSTQRSNIQEKNPSGKYGEIA